MANKIRYEIILHWSQEDQAFIAEVPELAGCAADGAAGLLRDLDNQVVSRIA